MLHQFRAGLLKDIVPETEFHVPNIIKSILVCFQGYGQAGGIIGGAVRDFVLNKPINDYDVYIPVDPKGVEVDVKEVMIWAGRYNYEVENVTEDSDYEGDGIIGVLKLTRADEVIDVIFGTRTLEDHVETFPIGLSQIWYDVLTGETHQHKNFVSATETGRCTVYNHRNAHPAIIELYVNKIQVKYPEITFTYHEYLTAQQQEDAFIESLR